MDKRSIYIIFAFAFLVGVFFQYSRMDGFLHLMSRKNVTGFPASVVTGELAGEKGQDKFLILYDPLDVGSVLDRHNLTEMLRRQKKAYQVASIYDHVEVLPEYRGVLLATGRLQLIPSFPAVKAYVEQGGTAVIFENIDKEDAKDMPAEYLGWLGIVAADGEKDVYGIRILTDLIMGGKGFSFGTGSPYNTHSLMVSLAETAKVHMTALHGEPLVWEQPLGKGKFLCYNGAVRDDRSNMGLMAAMLSACGQDSVYPVLGAKLFFLDDFPAPVPEGNFERLYEEVHLSTADFYRKVWWPFVLEMHREHGLKLTGLIIESYGDQVKGPFYPAGGREARDNLIIYGRELLDSGGELGLHGYNHQSLAPEGYNQVDLDYVPWASQADMEEGLRELRRYITDAYPGYTFRCYVPPSDILSPEGKAAVKNVFPELRIYSSLFDGPAEARAYYQDYEKNEDGTFEIPRVSSGHAPKPQSVYEDISVLNYMGIFSHFIHPDEIFYEESKDLTWHDMEEGMRSFLRDIDSRYPWLEGMTDSECMEYLDDYLNMDYRVTREEDGMAFHCVGFRKPLKFILRTEKEPVSMEGGTFESIGDGIYLLRVGEEYSKVAFGK